MILLYRTIPTLSRFMSTFRTPSRCLSSQSFAQEVNCSIASSKGIICQKKTLQKLCAKYFQL